MGAIPWWAQFRGGRNSVVGAIPWAQFRGGRNSVMGAIPWAQFRDGRNPVGRNSVLGAIPWAQFRGGRNPVGRNPVWAQSRGRNPVGRNSNGTLNFKFGMGKITIWKYLLFLYSVKGVFALFVRCTYMFPV